MAQTVIKSVVSFRKGSRTNRQKWKSDLVLWYLNINVKNFSRKFPFFVQSIFRITRKSIIWESSWTQQAHERYILSGWQKEYGFLHLWEIFLKKIGAATKHYNKTHNYLQEKQKLRSMENRSVKIFFWTCGWFLIQQAK